MRIGIACLVMAYVLSQFYRAFLAVLAPDLFTDIGAMPAGLADASGLWFLAFAAMQIPVGAALDRIGPRRTAAALLALGGGGGALIFAQATGPGDVRLAMALIGVGCSPVLMASYYIFARTYSAAVFATLAGATIGIGSLGNIAGSVPLVWAVGALGWRGTMTALAALTLLVALSVALFVKDPPKATGPQRGSLLDLLKMPALWPILIMMFASYAPSAGLRGLWIGPYVEEVYAAGPALIGQVTLIMGLAMIAGNFLYGPLDRLFGTRKWVIFWGNVIGALACLALFALPDAGLWASTALLAVVGLAGASFAVIVAHARALFPPHLTGRGVTLVNLFGIGGVGLMQAVTGRVHTAVSAGAADPAAPYAAIFLCMGLLLVAGLVAYLWSTDRTD